MESATPSVQGPPDSRLANLPKSLGSSDSSTSDTLGEKYVNSHQDHRTDKILWKSRITIKNQHYNWSIKSIHTSYCWLLSQHFLQILSQLHLCFLQPIIQTSPWPRKSPCCWRILTVRLGQSLPKAMLPVGSRLLPGKKMTSIIRLGFLWNIFDFKHVSKKPEDMHEWIWWNQKIEINMRWTSSSRWNDLECTSFFIFESIRMAVVWHFGQWLRLQKASHLRLCRKENLNCRARRDLYFCQQIKIMLQA